MKKLKLIPIFLLVVAIAFSIRIGDVAMKFASVQAPGEAIAAEEDDKEDSTAASAEESLGEPPAVDLPSQVFGGDLNLPNATFGDDEDILGGDNFGDVDYQVLEKLSERREELDAREDKIQQKEAILEATQQQIDQKLVELTKIRDEIKTLLNEQQQKEEKRIQSLVKVYEGMRPGDAANIFNELELSILIPVMENMSERKLSPILANMNANRARVITRRLAEKVQLPKLPEEQSRFRR